MDVFLIKDGVVINVAAVKSMEQAIAMYSADYTVVERTEDNCHINPGDPAP